MTSPGDPARTLALLWRTRDEPTRGPKPALSIDRIVAAATDIADTEGLAALSMRRVAERLGAGAMSLYTYVPGKADLIDLMRDTAYGETPRPAHPAGEWRAALTQVARQNWALCHRHPWLAQIPATRPVLGPGELAKYDYELRAIDGIGLTDVEMDSVLTLVLGHVWGAARASLEQAQVARQTGATDAQWWEAHAPVLARLMDADRYPVAARVGSAAGAAHDAAFDPRHAFEFGLRRILDGVEAFVRTR